MSKALDKVEENIFKLTSPDVKNNEFLSNSQIYNGYGCKGENLSPELNWSIPPVNTKSYALTVYDPDAPKKGGWYHWLVVNIPLSTHKVLKGQKITNALETVTDFKTTGYSGACPPAGHGKHRYIFTIYALDTAKLNVTKDSLPSKVQEEILSHAIAKSSVTSFYERK